MKKRMGILVMAVMTFALMGTGCKKGGSAQGGKLEFEPQGVVYINTNAILGASLLNKGMFAPMVQPQIKNMYAEMDKDKDSAKFFKCMGIDSKKLVKSIKGISVALTDLKELQAGGGEPKDFVAIVETSLNGGKLQKCAEEAVKNSKDKDKPQVAREGKTLVLKDKKVIVYMLSNGSIVALSPSLKDKVKPGSGAMGSGKAWNVVAAMGSKIGKSGSPKDALVVLLKDYQIPKDSMSMAMMMGGIPKDVADNLKKASVALTINLSKGIKLEALTDVGNKDVAKKLMDAQKKQLEQFSKMMPKFKGLLSKIKISQSGAKMNVNMDLSDQDVMTVIGAVMSGM